MSQKLLKKSRNRHLQQQLVENLIPNKPIKRNTFKYKPVSNLSIIKQDISNQWAFSWNQLKEGIKKSKSASNVDSQVQERKFLKGESGAQNIISTTLRLANIARNTEGGGLIKYTPENSEKFRLTSPDILNYRINQVVGGDLLGYLDRHLNQQYYFNGKEGGLVERNSLPERSCGTNVPIVMSTHLSGFSQAEEGGRRKVSKNLTRNFINRIKGRKIKPINQQARSLPGDSYSYTESAFFIKWHAEILSVADYLKVQNSWKKLYSFDEIHGGRDRIGDQRKREYMERRKISILYGNLPKRILVRLMRNALEEAGDISSKFLSALEKRLDVVLKRTLFFPTIRGARQWIGQGKILVNNRICTNTGFFLQPGDFVTISKERRSAWKKFWSFNTDSRPNAMEEVPPSFSTDKRKKTQRLVHVNPYTGSRRQFLLSPRLMQKFYNWGNLWGNSQLEGQVHQWTKLNSPFHRKKSIHTFFVSSCLNYYLKRKNRSNISLEFPFYADRYGRRITRCTNWLKTWQRTAFQQGYTRNHNSILAPQLLAGRHVKKKRRVLRNKLFLAALLHREAGNVIDGLFNFRWNKIFALKKSFQEKRRDWQFGAFKPIHIECCYKQGSAVFLYSPQKLVWPCNINVSLLKQALIN